MATDSRNGGLPRALPRGLQKLLVATWLLWSSPSWAIAPASQPFQDPVVEAHTLTFYRPRANGQGREGFVVDSQALIGTLKSRVLEARGLGEVAEVAPNDARSKSGQTEPQASYSFSHSFGPPFQALSTTLHLRPLDDPDETQLLNRLALGTALGILLALFAVYRMAATQIAFAERRNDFVSAVTHELKTPLTAIRMHSEMLLEGLVEDREKQVAYYRTITTESERLTRLINNVLELSRLEKRPTLLIRAGDPRPILRSAAQTLAPHAEREGFSLELDLAEALPAVLFEPDSLRQILFNLIDNSLKYGKDSTDRRITVSLCPSRLGVRLTVRDRGPGVPPDQLGLIFEPFTRGERELTRRFPGSGIGLALVKGLAESMRGRVSAQAAEPGLSVHVDLKSARDG